MACNKNYSEAKKFILELDKIAEKRKEEIRNTPTTVTVSGTKYYFSNEGDDANDGLSPESAWKTIAKFNSEGKKGTFRKGDGIFFRRGDTFRGVLNVQAGVTVTAYGEGKKPTFTTSRGNAAIPEKWTLVEGTEDIWVYDEEFSDVGMMVVNDSYVLYKEDPDLKDGRYRIPYTDEIFDFKKHLRDMRFLSYIEAANFHEKTGPVYLRCSKGNPGEVFEWLDICDKSGCVGMCGDGITIDNISVKYVGVHGICGGTLNDITIQNCEVGWIGGSIHFYRDGHECVRLGNGIQIYGGAVNFTVDNCYVHDCFDAGITHQYGGHDDDTSMENIQYSNNLVEDCQYNIEYFHSKSRIRPETRRDGRNVKMFGNICRRAGYGFGMDRSMCNGTIPAGNLITWNSRNMCDEGTFVLHDNIFDRSAKQMFTPWADKDEWYPVFDNNTYVVVEGCPLGRYKGQKEHGWYDDMKEKLPEILEDKNATVYIASAEEFGYKG